ncbi:unnamed protein product [Stenotrophomonas maltophilia]|nr:unnamed protein product [Stenotrophomonas maltophilia]
MGDALRAMHISPVVRNTVAAACTGAKPLTGQPWPWVHRARRERTDKTARTLESGQIRHAPPRQIQRWSTSSRFT